MANTIGRTAEEGHANTRTAILDTIIRQPDAFFANLQVTDEDLTMEEKREIADDLLTRTPATFLYRFGRFLPEDQLTYFDQKTIVDEEVAIHVQKFRAAIKSRKITIKNRRFQALQTL